MIAYHELVPQLKRLRLSGILDTLEVRNQQAVGEQWSYIEFLSRLVADEVERRAAKQLALRLRRGQVDTTKTLETFDFNFNPTLNRRQVYDLATCEFVRQKRNCLVVGQTGVGKTHLAQALSHEAARRGFDVLFTTTHRMLLHLVAARAEGAYERRLATYLKPDLLVLDDFGLKQLPPSGPDDLYDVIDGRYERRSLLLTSNRAAEEWSDLLGHPLLANAALDRLLDRAHIVTITGRSYRLAGRTADGADNADSTRGRDASARQQDARPPASGSVRFELPVDSGDSSATAADLPPLPTGTTTTTES
jgi:DNA replication protein DnaC